MTTPSTARKAGPFTGNGSQTAWPFTFKVFAAADVKVTIANAAGTETVLTLGTDYTVSLNANQDTSPGGTVTYPLSGSALPVGSVLSITGDIDYDQPLDLPSGGNFSPLALENQLDRATMQIQQLKEEVDRAAKLPVTNAGDPVSLVEDLVRLADSADNIDTVVANLSSVTTVASDLNEPVSEINTVATSIANVNAVGTNITNVNTVAGISANVTSVAGNATNINAVAGNATNINAVNANKTNIDAVAANEVNIDAVAGNATNINAVAGNATNINAVVANETNIDAVAANGADIDTVAANISSVNTAATNIAAIIAAPSEAASAAASAAAAAASAASGMYSTVQDKSADYTVVSADAGDLIRVSTSGGARTITLPAIATQEDGFKVAIAKWSSDADAVTIARSSTDLINGSATYVLDAQYKSATFVADAETGTWFAAGTGGGGTNIIVDPFTGDGTTTVFTLSGDPGSKNNTLIGMGGSFQLKSTYSHSGTTITFNTPPPDGVAFEVQWSIPLSIGTPSDGTVSTAKLADSAVTLVKLIDGVLAATTEGLAKMADGFLAATTAGRAKMADLFVTTAKIDNNAVTLGKMARVGTAGQVLVSGGPSTDPSYQDNPPAFATGTSMLFVQTAAPTGWTKSTAHNDKALRVVSGTASSGGSVAFTTAFASGLSGGATTLSESQIPSHVHGVNGNTSNSSGSPYHILSNTNSTPNVTNNTNATGGGGSHTHTLPSFAVSYVDTIIATKD